MQPHKSLQQALESSRGPALIAFLTAGYPDSESFLDVLGQVEAAADAVEIGVPFTDPMADGVTIQRSSHAAIQQRRQPAMDSGPAGRQANGAGGAAAVDELSESAACLRIRCTVRPRP